MLLRFLHFRTRILIKNATLFIDFSEKRNGCLTFLCICVFLMFVGGWGSLEASNFGRNSGPSGACVTIIGGNTSSNKPARPPKSWEQNKLLRELNVFEHINNHLHDYQILRIKQTI